MTTPGENAVPPKSASGRRVFDRSVAFARCRWECLRRSREYREQTWKIIDAVAKSMKWDAAKLEQYCLDEGGILERGSGDGAASGAYYDAICARYGVRVLMHPDVSFSDDQMARFPVFADTPRRQSVVRDQALLRRVARRGGDISPRTLRRVFIKKKVEAGPFQMPVERLHFHRFDSMLAVFDARIAGKQFSLIANELGQSLNQVKRAWRLARVLIEKWLDFERHIATCRLCQACIEGRRDRYCGVIEAEIGVRAAPGPRLQPMPDQALALVNARVKGHLPARRSVKQPTSSGRK
jgi:hypothetical protein